MIGWKGQVLQSRDNRAPWKPVLCQVGSLAGKSALYTARRCSQMPSNVLHQGAIHMKCRLLFFYRKGAMCDTSIDRSSVPLIRLSCRDFEPEIMST